MRTFRIAFAAAVLLAGLWAVPASANNIGRPTAAMTADGQQFNIPLTQLSKGWAIGDQLQNDEYFWAIETQEFSVRLSGMLDPDPSIAYGIAVADFGLPSVFGFAFLTPIVPTGAPNSVTGSIVGGLTDFTGNGVSLTPTGATAQTSSVALPFTNMGVDVGGPFVAGPGAAGSFYAYGPFAAGPIAGPGPGPWTALSATLGFTLSGGSDVAALTGFSSIVPAAIPEPASALLLTLGLVSLAARRRSH